MKQLFKVIAIFLYCILINSAFLFAQRVYPLMPGIAVDSILETKPGATKMAYEKVSGHLFYSTANGDIYEVYIPGVGSSTDSLRYTAADHGISSLQGLYFRDSVVYVCGNIWSSTTTVGKIVKGTLQPNGARLWVDVVTTDAYPSASSYGDHGFTGVNLDPAGNYIYVSSGARTHLGEVRTNNGAWPGYREVPMTSRIFKFPVTSAGIVLPNDSTLLDNSGYVFAWGTRNAYDMAWDGNDTLFTIDNSGERDDPEELNWLREGKHYGFPWRMGGNYNPLMVSPYDADLDPLVNPLSGGYLNGWFADDPTFPPVPVGLTFTEPVRNYGTEADFYRDSITGVVKNAGDEGTYITSFTSHRAPLGLVFDKDSMLAAPFRGDGFVLSFMPGGDSSGYTILSPWGSPCPFVDSSRELVQMKLTYNAGIDNYTMTTANVVGGFYLPVDAELISNVMYVIEHGGDIWRITFPLYVSVPGIENTTRLSLYPNPASSNSNITISYPSTSSNKEIIINDINGKEVTRYTLPQRSSTQTVKLPQMARGIYAVRLVGENVGVQKLVVE
jgi:hypothetical protein